MKKAIAIPSGAFKPAYHSARNFFALAIDFMYGSEERVKYTYAFAMALLILGVSMMPSEASNLAVCAK